METEAGASLCYDFLQHGKASNKKQSSFCLNLKLTKLIFWIIPIAATLYFSMLEWTHTQLSLNTHNFFVYLTKHEILNAWKNGY